MQYVLINCLGVLSLPGKSVVGLADGPDMTIAVNHRQKTKNNINTNGANYRESAHIAQDSFGNNGTCRKKKLSIHTFIS